MGSVMDNLDAGAFLDELKKIARERNPVSDFVAGVDPTGTFTFEYGMDDADRPDDKARQRRIIGVLGGLIGGGLAVPVAISGVIGAARGLARQGVKGVAPGLLQGMKRPIQGPLDAFKVRAALKTGKPLGSKDVGAFYRLVKQTPGFSDLAPAIAKAPGETSVILRAMGPGTKTKVTKAVSDQLAQAVSVIGLSAGVGGTSAAIQYAKGRETGKAMRKNAVALSPLVARIAAERIPKDSAVGKVIQKYKREDKLSKAIGEKLFDQRRRRRRR
jgi:hypothetical protein